MRGSAAEESCRSALSASAQRRVGRESSPGPRDLPAPLAPLREMGPLVAEDRVVAVAGVEPGLVGEAVEDLGADLVDQGREGVRVSEGVADTAREEAVACPEVRG